MRRNSDPSQARPHSGPFASSQPAPTESVSSPALAAETPPSALSEPAPSSFVSAPVDPRWSKLYTDALHSIFGFTDLKQLLRLVRVSRHWSEAAFTTPSLCAVAEVRSDAHLRLLCASRLRSQVACLQEDPAHPVPSYSHEHDPSYVIRGVALMQQVSTQLSGLHELHVQPFDRFPHEDDVAAVCLALSRMHQLRSLHFVIDDEDCRNAEEDGPAIRAATNRIMRTIGVMQAPMLHSLHLRLPLHSSLSFAPLAALPALRRLRLGHSSEFLTSGVAFSDAQVDELRSLTGLHEFSNPLEGDDGMLLQQQLLTRILQPGHKLKWTQLVKRGETLIVSDPQLAPLLASLPTLTSVRIFLEEDRVEGENGEELVPGYVPPSLSFFLPLRQLTSLEAGGWRVDYDELVQVIGGCSVLTSLSLINGPANSRHLEAMLPCFPRLSAVSIFGCTAVASLRCFNSPALSASLTSLKVHWCFQLSHELHHLLGLRSLVSLDFHGPLSPQAEHIGAFVPRSERFPQLQTSSVS